jgi:hypothetical protein
VYVCACGWRPAPHLRRANGGATTVKQQATEHWRSCRGTAPPLAKSLPGLRARIGKDNGPKNAEANRLRAVAAWSTWRAALVNMDPVAASVCCNPNTEAAYGKGAAAADGFTYLCKRCGVVRHLHKMRRFMCKSFAKTCTEARRWAAAVSVCGKSEPKEIKENLGVKSKKASKKGNKKRPRRGH